MLNAHNLNSVTGASVSQKLLPFEWSLGPDGVCLCCFACLTGKYRTQLWDKQTGSFLPATPGLGMHVEIKDPDTKVRTEEVVLWITPTYIWIQSKEFFLPTPPDYPFSTIWVRRTVHLHLPHSWRTSDLFTLQLHQDGSVCRRKTGMKGVTALIFTRLKMFHTNATC